MLWRNQNGSRPTPLMSPPTSTLSALRLERLRVGTFRDNAAHYSDTLETFRRIEFALDAPVSKPVPLKRLLARFPFVPADEGKLDDDCYEAYNIQVKGLLTRLQSSGVKKIVIGVSGGLDSTQALLVAVRAMDLMQAPRKNIIAITMPGFATSAHTKSSAIALDGWPRRRPPRTRHQTRRQFDAEGYRPSVCAGRKSL